MCWKREFDKVYHIKNIHTNDKICDIHLNIIHNHTLCFDNVFGNITYMSVKVDENIARQEGDMGTNCCGVSYNTVSANMPVKIKYNAIPELFDHHNVEWVLDLGPLFAKPYNRMHLYIDSRNVMDQTDHISSYTNPNYKCAKFCIKFWMFMLMTIVFGIIYTFIMWAILDDLGLWLIVFWFFFGAFTWHQILGCIGKSVCKCIEPGRPQEVIVLFDPVSIELVVNNEGEDDHLPLMKTTNELPIEWRKLYTNDGKVYYQNDIMKITQWDKPETNSIVN